jgi:hypothetical protein
LPGAPVATNALTDALELLRHALIGGCDIIEQIGDLAAYADLLAEQPDREIPRPDRLQRVQQFVLKAAAISNLL